MVRLRRGGGLACAAVAVIAVLIGWLQGAPDLTRSDAVRFTTDALETIGLQRVEVSDRVRADTYRVRGTAEELPVWRTSASVARGTIAVLVNRRLGQAVYIDDVTADGTKRLLSDRQFAALGEVTTYPARDRRVVRNVAGTLAALLVTGVAILATAIVPRRLQETSTS